MNVHSYSALTLLKAQRNLQNAFQLVENTSKAGECSREYLKCMLSEADLNLKVSHVFVSVFQRAAYEIAYGAEFSKESLRKLLDSGDGPLLQRTSLNLYDLRNNRYVRT